MTCPSSRAEVMARGPPPDVEIGVIRLLFLFLAGLLVFIAAATWTEFRTGSRSFWIPLAALAALVCTLGLAFFVQRLKSQVNKQRSQLKDTEHQNDELRSQLKDSEHLNDKLHSQQKDLIQARNSLQAKLNGKEDRLVISSIRTARQKDELRQYKAGAKTFKAGVKALLENIARLAEDLQISQAKNVELQAKTVEAQAKNVELQARNAELQGTTVQLQAKNAELLSDQSKNMCYTASLESSFTETKQKLSREREKVAAADAAEAQVEALQLELDEKQLKLDEKEKIIARMREYFEHGATRMAELGQEGTGRSKVTVESVCAEEQKASEHGSRGS